MRTFTLLAVSALFVALGSGCALDQGADLDDVQPALETADEQTPLDQGQLQAPPVKLRILENRSPLIAMLALKTDVGSYAGQKEHWFAPQGMQITAPPSASTLELEADPIGAETDATIADWSSPLGLAFSCGRVVSPDAWSRDLVAIPEGAGTRLYSTPHPDNPDEVLAMLVVTDPTGKLLFTAWYRSTRPDQTGRAFGATTFLQPLQPVVDRDGNLSANPNEIRVADWHSIVMKP